MLSLNDVLLFVLVVSIQGIGIASVIVARLTERSWARDVSQQIFFASLLLVGLATAASLYLDSSNWLPCAATLGVMSVGATLDLGSSRQPANH